MFQITPAFAVPLVIAKLDDCQALNAQLRELFLEKEAQGDKYRNPEPMVYRNTALFESNFRLFDWPQSCIATLRTFCYRNLYRAIGELNGYDQATLQKLHISVESWFHIARRGGYFGAHNHAMHSWSGVYCVKHEDDDPNSQSGLLTFINPNGAGSMFLDMALASMKPPYALSPRMLRLEPGQLVLFPSWLLHEVLPYEGTSERITVAFNARFAVEGARPADVPLG
ncbi:putative 2OG-Fe(II) oxygenase [Arenimonas sp.]|uniref:putative 2OG-Fe(II) oxygenase n=1 Tax=Arenimonas sp. TaxID=1872635 RepID=UPI0035B02932